MHQVAIVADVVPPSLHTVRQYSLSVLLFDSGLDSQGGEDLGEESPICRLPVKDVHPDGIVQVRAVALPIHECNSARLVILLSK